jgi:signal transduction histidine kinase
MLHPRLGLHLCGELSRFFGGKIWGESGPGASFHLTIPVGTGTHYT